MNTRGAHEILGASNHRSVPIDPRFPELDSLALKDGVLDPHLYAKGARLFLDESPA